MFRRGALNCIFYQMLIFDQNRAAICELLSFDFLHIQVDNGYCNAFSRLGQQHSTAQQWEKYDVTFKAYVKSWPLLCSIQVIAIITLYCNKFSLAS